MDLQVDTFFECILGSPEILSRVEREGWVEATPARHLTVQVSHRVSARRRDISQELPDVDAGRRVPPLRQPFEVKVEKGVFVVPAPVGILPCIPAVFELSRGGDISGRVMVQIFKERSVRPVGGLSEITRIEEWIRTIPETLSDREVVRHGEPGQLRGSQITRRIVALENETRTPQACIVGPQPRYGHSFPWLERSGLGGGSPEPIRLISHQFRL